MLDFLNYFFGKSENIEFTNFSLAHFLPIVITAAIIFLIYHFRENIKDMKNEIAFRYIIAFTLIFSEMSYYWRLIAIPSLSPNPVDHLPITVCGWVAVFGSYMVIGKSQTLFDICYFWALAGSIFALITPTVISYTGPTRFRYYQFWAEHLFCYIALLYMIFIHKMRPKIKSFIKKNNRILAFSLLLIISGVFFYYFVVAEDSDSNKLTIKKISTHKHITTDIILLLLIHPPR